MRLESSGAPPRYTALPSGNGEPEMWMDEQHRACWADRSRVRLDECSETPANRKAVTERFELTDDHSFDLDLVGAIVRDAGATVLGIDGSEVRP